MIIVITRLPYLDMYVIWLRLVCESVCDLRVVNVSHTYRKHITYLSKHITYLSKTYHIHRKHIPLSTISKRITHLEAQLKPTIEFTCPLD